jgi:hypothetical protein
MKDPSEMEPWARRLAFRYLAVRLFGDEWADKMARSSVHVGPVQIQQFLDGGDVSCRTIRKLMDAMGRAIHELRTPPGAPDSDAISLDRPQVPRIPRDAVNWNAIRGRVWRSGDMRWRTLDIRRDSVLYGFVEYGPEKPDGIRPVLRYHGDWRF